MAKATLDTQAKEVMPGYETPLTVLGHNIRQNDKGLICLTDLHKAAGSPGNRRVNYWLNNDSTEEFIQQVARESKSRKSGIIETKVGRYGGTYAHWQIALAYAKWLSPELHMAVNETYMRYKSGDHTLAMEVIDKQTDPNKLADIEVRARSIRCHPTALAERHAGELIQWLQYALQVP